VCWPLEEVRGLVAPAGELELSVHLDGAACSTPSGREASAAAEIGGHFDTVTLCLSKGSAARSARLVAGSAELMAKGRRLKHQFGGAMRQAGIVAAAGVYALDHNVERLADDHVRARRLAEAFTRGVPVYLERVETNFVQ
jgi:threonine aldolase